jgi:hypothetical protein
VGFFDTEARTCPDCGTTFDALVLWADTVPCDDCGKIREAARWERIRAGRDYEIAELGGACPTQATGRNVDGRPFYFRARHGHWTLELGQPGWPTDYSDWPHDVMADEPEVFLAAQGDDDTHGWMEDEAVLAILDRHLPVPSTTVKDRP